MVAPMKYWLSISTSLEMDIAYQTLERLKEAIQNDFHPEVILHSDQGFHYTHLFFQAKVTKLGISQYGLVREIVEERTNEVIL
jgi:hypothetical protein